MSETPPERNTPIWRSAMTLAIIAGLCTALVAITHQTTRQRIAANEQAYLEESLQPVLEGIAYDGELSDSTLIIDTPHGLPGNTPVTVYRVYAAGQPIAALFVVTTRNGYSGPISLLVGIDANGVLNRARVLEHRETPGLGDRIESAKSNWMNQFDKASVIPAEISRWSITKDGGDFDALTGASITSRAVVNALRDTLSYFELHRDTLFDAEPGTATRQESRNGQ